MKDLQQNEFVIAGVAVVMMILTYATFSGASENEAAVIEFDNSAMPERIYDTETVDFTQNKPNVHIVKRGDTVYSIARMHDLDARTLMAINDCGKCDNLTVGQEINLD